MPTCGTGPVERYQRSSSSAASSFCFPALCYERKLVVFTSANDGNTMNEVLVPFGTSELCPKHTFHRNNLTDSSKWKELTQCDGIQHFFGKPCHRN